MEILSLELITLSVKSTEAETVRGVRVTVSGTCQVKVDAFTHDDLSQNLPQITLACQHFLGKVGISFKVQHTYRVHGRIHPHGTHETKTAVAQQCGIHPPVVNRKKIRNLFFSLLTQTPFFPTEVRAVIALAIFE